MDTVSKLRTENALHLFTYYSNSRPRPWQVPVCLHVDICICIWLCCIDGSLILNWAPTRGRLHDCSLDRRHLNAHGPHTDDPSKLSTRPDWTRWCAADDDDHAATDQLTRTGSHQTAHQQEAADNSLEIIPIEQKIPSRWVGYFNSLWDQLFTVHKITDSSTLLISTITEHSGNLTQSGLAFLC